MALPAPTPISLGLRTNPARSTQAGNAQLINCYAKNVGEDAKSPLTINAVEKLSVFGSPLAGGAIRAMIVVGETLYVVAGRNVYAVGTGGAATLIGGIPTNGPVYLASNRKVPAQIGMVSDGLYLIIDTGSNSVSEVNDPDLPSAVSLSSIDGYFAIPVVNGEYFITAVDDGTLIDGLDFGTAETYSDDISRSMVLERDLILMGPRSIEFHQNTGDADFPFTRVHAIEIGILAPDSAALADTPTKKTVLWVAPDHTVRRLDGYTPQIVSTPEIQDLIRDLHQAGNIADLRGFGWSHSGEFFYCLACSAWARTLDLSSGYWHSRKSYLQDTWRISSAVQFGTKMIAGDRETGQLYVMEFSTAGEADDHQIMSVISPPVHAFPYGLKFHALYLDAATGVGLNTGTEHADNPKVMISWSKDGGSSFSATRERDLHRDAQVRRVKPVYRLGRCGAKGMVFKFDISSPVQRLLIGASVSTSQLNP